MEEAGNLASVAERIIEEKLELIPGLLRKHNVDAWLVLAREDSDPLVSYFVNGHLVMESAFLFTPDGNQAYLGHIELMNSRAEHFDTRIEYSPGSLWDALVPALHKLNPSRLALDFSESDHTADGLTHGLHRKLAEFAGSEWLAEREISGEEVISDLRGIKSPTEIELLRTSAEITIKVAQEIGQRLYPGITHGELHQLFEELVAADGRSTPEFFIPTSGRIGEIFRGKAEDPVRAGDSLILDMGVRHQGYTSDYKRMWYFLEPGESQPPQPLLDVFNLCREIIQETRDALLPGTRGCDVDAIARKRLTDLGYEEFKHALGHQVGRAVHDGGVSLGPEERYARSTKQVQPNMLFTLDPSIRQADTYPASLEDGALVVAEGPAEFFVPPQEELWLVPADAKRT
jgi:Xaa-Pro aminopeptidase